MYRVVSTTLRGQFEDDRCFLDWVAMYPTVNARIVDWRDQPQNDGGVNDRRWYVWFHDVPMKTANVPGCPRGLPGLITRDGKNGWETEAEARAVRDAHIGQSAEIKAMADAANEKATSISNIAGGLAGDIVEGAADVVTGEAIGTTGKIFAAVAIMALAAWFLNRKG